MLKNVKIISILVVIILLVGSLSVFATDINMNLTSGNVQNSTNTLSNTTVTTNTVTNETTTNTTSNVTISSPVDYSQQTTTVTSTTSVQDEGLGIANILNILLIVVGFVLILLGIAIIIRMHS